MLKDTRPFSAVKGVIDIGSGNFIDVEQERDVFAKNVRDLLERSGKKNILLVIDNIDRIEGEDQLLLILSEFASINGIISILSLDPKKDSELMGSSADKSGTEPEELGNYNKLDKYIHARIRIEEIEGIEYDKHVSKQIIEEAKRIRFDPESFIQVDGKYRNSLFQNSSKVEDEKNLLTKLFFINFERSGLSFGKYFENLVMNYFCNSEEISRLNKKANSRDGLPENSQNDRIKNLWSNDSFYQEHEWPDRLQFNIKQILSLFDFFISIIKSINEDRNADQYTLLLQSIFTNKRFDSSVNIEKAAYDQYCDAIAFMYKPEEAELLNNYILRKESDKIESYFNESKNAVTALLYQSFILCDFMKYLRSCMKNYRCFKIQLRECEILDLNYLDYAIKHWKLSNETKTLIDSDTCFKEMDKSNVQSLKSIIKGILFEEYIHNYGGSFELKLSSELKVHLLKKNNNEWVSIEHKTDDETKTYELKVGETKISEEK